MRRLALIAVALALASAGVTYLVPDPIKENAAPALAAGERAGTRDGRAQGGRTGYRDGFSAGRDRAFARARRQSYLRAYRRAFTRRGLPPPAAVPRGRSPAP